MTAMKKAQEEREQLAASKIQAGARGYLTRKRIKAQKGASFRTQFTLFHAHVMEIYLHAYHGHKEAYQCS